MCFINSTFMFPRIALWNIVCYKSMYIDSHGNFHSAMYHTKDAYAPGATILPATHVPGNMLTKMLHLNNIQYLEGEVVHSYTKQMPYCNVKCIIPRGTIFWKDRYNHEYASLRLRIVKAIPPEINYYNERSQDLVFAGKLP